MVGQQGVIPIVGPFGCGKTTLIALAATGYIGTYPDRRGVIYAETNDAVNENLRRVARSGVWDDGALLRMGDCETVGTEFPRFCLDELLHSFRRRWEAENGGEDDDATSNGGARFRGELRAHRRTLLERARIVFGTSSALAQDELRELQFHLSINDEGGQTPDAGLVMALRRCTSTLAMIGDPHQLPPYRSESDVDRKTKFAGQEHRLDKSALEDYWELGRALCLDTQYHCHPKIMAVLQMFYEQPVVSAGLFSEPGWLNGWRFRPGRLACRLGSHRVVLASLPQGYEMVTADRSFTNPTEAHWVTEKLQELAQHKRANSVVAPKWNVLVITPYRGQLQLLREIGRRLGHRWAAELNVDWVTADSCQGRETDISGISLVRRNASQSAGFLSISNRMLTMLSRAREYMLIATHVQTVGSEPLWDHVFKRMRQIGAFIVEDPRSADEISH